MPPFGYVGQILWVDLDEGSLSVESPPDEYYRKLFGGRALIAQCLLRGTPEGLDPLGPDNLLIFTSGPVTGTPVSGSGRHGVGAKSPLTGGIASSEAGGYWGTELKRSGFDAIVVRGSSPNPVYLWVSNGVAELRDATSIWGKTTAEADEWLKASLENDKIRTSIIGPAGENLVKYANINFDLRFFAGRGGLGAVMGSKRLKAVAVEAPRGKNKMALADRDLIRRVARWMGEHRELVEDLYDTGTPGGVIPLNYVGGLPSYNFREGQFEKAEAISGERMRDTMLVARDACFACTVHCKRTVELDHPFPVPRKYGGPEYETIAALGSNLGIGNLPLVAHINTVCSANGLDTISAGGAIAFAMECFESGLITKEDTGGIDLEFGNEDAMVWLIDRIIHREGIGDLLAEGVRTAAEEIGGDAHDFALHVKGQELPLHEPRLKQGMGLGYAVSPTGADHEHNMHDSDFTQRTLAFRKMLEFGDFEPMKVDDLGESKVRLFTYHCNWQHMVDCLIMCRFLPYDVQQTVDIVNGATGWNVDKWELLLVGERAATLSRLFNLREGISSEKDKLPKRFFQEFTRGPLEGVAIDPAAFRTALRNYYTEMGWDEEGKPGLKRMKELGIEEYGNW
jgi:aldehyde:ferredoxin oxidoreductase